MNPFVTLEETWARCFEPELKRKSAEWNCRDARLRSRPRKFQQGPSQAKDDADRCVQGVKRVILLCPPTPQLTAPTIGIFFNKTCVQL